MTLKYHESPFHATHDADVASKMAMKMDLAIMLANLMDEKKWTQKQAAEKFGVSQSRVSDLRNKKIENFTIDAMFDMLDKLGLKVRWEATALNEAKISISQR